MTAANVLTYDFLKKSCITPIINRVQTVTIEAYGGNILEFNSLKRKSRRFRNMLGSGYID